MKLDRGDSGGSYAEAAIILCAVLSALAAEVWPGRGSDRKRFVQLLIEYSSATPPASFISTPLLCEYLRYKEEHEAQEQIRRNFLPHGDTRVLAGAEADANEHDIRLVYAIDLRVLREHSYANLLYTDLRSSYAHEYEPGGRADSFGMNRDPNIVSYVNRFAPDGGIERLIYFGIPWLGQLVTSIAEAIEGLPSLPRPHPSYWWIDG